MLCYVCFNMLCYTDSFEEFLQIRNVKNTHNIFSVSLYPLLFSSLHINYTQWFICFTKINCTQTYIYNAVFKSYCQWSIVKHDDDRNTALKLVHYLCLNIHLFELKMPLKSNTYVMVPNNDCLHWSVICMLWFPTMTAYIEV